MLQFIFEIHDEYWAKPETISDLVRAFKYVVTQQKKNDIILENDCLTKKTLNEQEWGDWVFDPNKQKLYHKPLEISNSYPWEISAKHEIDLKEITSCKILDCIFDIYGREWAQPQTIYDLVTAFRSIFAWQ